MFKIGDLVSILSGPYDGYVGHVVAIDPSAANAWVKTNVFGRDVDVPVALDAIRAGEGAPPRPVPVGANWSGSATPPQSWRLTTDIGDQQHYALFVREAFRLAIEGDPSTPPRLTEQTPDLSDRLSTAESSAAAAAWPTWWAAVAGLEGGSPASHRLAAMAMGGDAIDDTPRLDTLNPEEVLRRAALGCQGEARGCAKSIRRRFVESKPWQHLDHRDINDVLDQKSLRTGLPKNTFEAEVVLIDVAGPWWTLTKSGAVLASVAALGDRQVVRKMLEAAFRRP